MTNASVILWGREIGAVSWVDERNIGVFQYAPEFIDSNIQVAPLMMPLRAFPYEFPSLAYETFRGLPGLLSDSLPDKWGNAVIDHWLAAQGRTAENFNPVERLCYIGRRGMGALEFEPSNIGPTAKNKSVEVTALADLAARILNERTGLDGVFSGADDKETIEDILRVGTSAGGARAKAILAWNPQTGEFRSGQIDAEKGFEHWLMKFDGIANNRDKELADPQGFGRLEYAYHLMAVDAGIEMTPCRLHKEGGRGHFMTRRFDRTSTGNKLHMQTLGAMAHYDYNMPASYSYEQALQVIARLQLPREDVEQQILRTFFNIVGRNHDDHVKNIAFLMDRDGSWRLSPAFDLSYSWNPQGSWTAQHQMSVNNKRDGFERADLIAFAQTGDIKQRQAIEMIERVIDSVKRWKNFADKAGIPEEQANQISKAHRLTI